MPTYKDEARDTRYCRFRYTDYAGAKHEITKRGFKTKKAALQYEAKLKAQSGDTAKLTMNALCDAYLAVRLQAPAINEHIKNIYDEQELSPEATISKMEIVQNEGTTNRRPQEIIKISPTIRPGPALW